MDNIEKLYQNYELLSKADEDITKFENEYKEIINAAKGDTQEKQLASQFIPYFFKSFPGLAEEALNEHINLCEETDTKIRMQAIKNLPVFCKQSKDYIPKVANVLTQLLESYTTTEQIIVQNSIMEILKMDAKSTLIEIFNQILNGNDTIRERAINLVGNKVKSLGPDVITREIEELLLLESKKVLQDVTGDEFLLLMSMLTSLKISKLVPGQQSIVEMVADQADLDKPFPIAEIESLDRLLTSIKQILPHFSKFVTTHKFVEYICLNILPHLEEIPKQENTEPSLELLKLLAELIPNVGTFENLNQALEATFKTLLNYLPLPPQENVDDDTIKKEEKDIFFTHIECLLFVFHQLAKADPTFLTSESNTERHKDLRIRLQFLALKLQGYIRQLKSFLQDEKSINAAKEENKVKLIALRTTTNINNMIKDLFHNPPTFKVNFILSWKDSVPKKTIVAVKAPLKRPAESTEPFNNGSKFARRNLKEDRQLYAPPSGKFSTKFQMGDMPFRRGRGRGRGRGNRGRGWRY